MIACPLPEIVCLPAVKQGDTWNLQFTWSQGEDPLDLTGCTAILQVRDQRGRLVGTPDDISIDLETGVVTVLFEAVTTATIPVGTHFTDMQIVFSDGAVRSSATCALPVLADQTR